MIANTRGKAGLDEIIKIAVKNALRIALFNIGSQILYHLIRVQNIRPDLVSPANIGFALRSIIRRIFTALQFQFVKASFQHI